MSNAYCQWPTLYEDQVVFVSDNDLWSVSKFGGQALRLTTTQGLPMEPCFSPDGSIIAFSSNETGARDIYQIPASGGAPERLTFCSGCRLVRWIDKNNLIFMSNFESFNMREPLLYKLNVKTKKIEKYNFGPARYYAKEGKNQIIGRNLGDPARWKRYRGGTAGTLWADTTGRSQYKQILKNLKTNISSPALSNGRVYFISDHEGIANIYSTNIKGGSIKRHTHENEYYVRWFSLYEKEVLYAAGGELYLTNLKEGYSTQIDINVRSSFVEAQDRFEDADDYLEAASLSSDLQEIVVSSRGQLFVTHPWLGGVHKLGEQHRRYRIPIFTKTKNKFLAVELGKENEESVVLFDSKSQKSKKLTKKNIGKIWTISPNPHKEYAAVSTNRNELWLLSTQSGALKKIDSLPSDSLSGQPFKHLSWSPCGSYLAYSNGIGGKKQAIKLFELGKSGNKVLFDSVSIDMSPTFDPSGRYLFFLGIREYNPVYNESHFDLGFPFAVRPYVAILQKDSPSPLELKFGVGQSNDDDEDEDTKKKAPKKIKIDLKGIEHRILALPTKMGGYQQLHAAKDKLFYTRQPIKGLDPNNYNWHSVNDDQTLYCYDFKTGKEKVHAQNADLISWPLNNKSILYYDEDLRIVSINEKPNDGEGFNKKDGWINLDRFKVKISPREEWRQIYQEAWILQREHFWTEDMSKINWQQVYKKYLKVLPKVNTRFEFSDLLWEMQGELGTSHAYEVFGDYFKSPPKNFIGLLGASLSFIPARKCYRIDEIFNGPSWIKGQDSPLNSYSCQLKVGDLIHAVDGELFSNETSLYECLENKAGSIVSILAQRKGSNKKEKLSLKTLGTQNAACYQHWVEKNRKYVEAKTGGKIGYVHIPDMGIKGYSEFYRQYLPQSVKEGLIIDVRYNGGGHVSAHVLKVLAQKTIGICVPRFGAQETYPETSTPGNFACITNEHAGSDGDIFSHSFKLMKLGKLIGKRTWGGVIGIWPKNDLVDGTLTTQPEYSFWFKDVDFGVENFGTKPDIEVDILPQDYIKGKDPQLDRGIIEVLKSLKGNPKLKADLKTKPNLKLPTLPKI